MHALKRFWSAHSHSVFSLDLRSLALFRAALAVVLVWDCVSRYADLGAFYTDAGLMPRSWLTAFGDPLRISLHLASGAAWFQALALGAQTLAAFALFFGWRTRVAIVVAWGLSVSLATRNPLVLTPADVLMNCLLFWSLFLPLHARWSLDAALSSTPPPRESHLSWAGAGLLVQVLAIYFFSALAMGSIDAGDVRRVLGLNNLVYPWAAPLLTLPGLDRGLSVWLWWLLLLGPLLALSPIFTGYLRAFVLINLALLNLGLMLSLAVGPLPWVATAGLLALLGSGLWDRLARRRAARQGPGELRIYYDGDCAFCARCCRLLRELLMLPEAGLAPAQSSARAQALMQANNSWVVIDRDDSAHLKWSALLVLLRRSPLLWPLSGLLSMQQWRQSGDRAYDYVATHRGAFAKATTPLLAERGVAFEAAAWTSYLAAGALIAVLLWNLATVQALPRAVNRALAPAMVTLGLDQRWDAFAYLPRDDGWFVVAGEQLGGTTIDVLRPERGAPDYLPPRWAALEHKNARWQAYRARVLQPQHEAQRRWWARHLCDQWNEDLASEASARLRNVRLIYLLRSGAAAAHSTATEQRVLWREDCTEGTSD